MQREAQHFPAGREDVGIDCLILRVHPSMVESPKGQQTCRNGGVAQLGEHLPCKQGVDSSILFISTRSGRIKRGRPKARIVGGSATEMGS